MSKIPIERHGKLPRTSEVRDYSHCKTKQMESLITAEIIKDARGSSPISTNEEKPKKPFISLIPKMNSCVEKVVEQNPRILDLREKLNEITKKQNIDKETKGIINDITQKLVDEKDDKSGPYSLLLDLQSSPSTSHHDVGEIFRKRSENKSISSKSVERLPNVLNFDDKPMKEFEYSCENEFNAPAKKVFNTHSRSDLCLTLKSHRPYEPNLSPNENSSSRANEENSLDDSLGILTPDQMDDMCYMDNTFSPSVEGLPIFYQINQIKPSPDNADSPSTEKTESNSAASAIQNEVFDAVINKEQEFQTVFPVINVDEGSLSQTAIDSFNQSTRKFDETVTGNGDIVLVSEVELAPSLDDELLPSIHSSILEPASSVAEPAVNLGTSLGIYLGKDVNTVVNRVEQTPSPEDLPLDNSEFNGEISTYSQLSSSTLHDSHTYSDSKIDYPKSMETSKVSNSFITSITSITSLDGYQGDGEMSRPVSRGADHSISHREDVAEMEWQNVPVTRRPDPMTDSDFFTESDADGLDDNIQRGDRRAQVIDGALYGGTKGNGNPPLIVNRNDDSCMESSGVYTDFETPVFLNAIDDVSPTGSTPSTQSECSQKNGAPGKLEVYFDNLDKRAQNTEKNEAEVQKSVNSSKRNSMNSVKDTKAPEKSKEDKKFTLKKYKMPKRDVPSKLKSMLTTRKIDADSSTQSTPKSVKKVERRQTFAKKNYLELKSDYKTKSFKDVKSKVDCSPSLQRSQTSCSVNRMLSSKATNINTPPNSRHLRMRLELGSSGSGKSSLHSSQSDLSATSTPPGKHPTTRFPLNRNGKKRESPQTPAPRVPASTPQPPSQVSAKKNGVVQKLSASPVSVRSRTSLAPPSSPRKPSAPHRTPAQRPSALPTNKEPSRVSAALGPRGKRAAAPQQARSEPAPVAQPLVPRHQTAALAHAAKGVEALGVLVQYLVFRLDALNGDSWRLEAERWRGVAAAERTSAARADQDRQQRAQKDLDTIAECLSKISELEIEVSSKEEASTRLQVAHIREVSALANDIKELKETIESLKQEVAESRTRLHAHSEIERTLRAQLEAVRSELDSKRNNTKDDKSYDKSEDLSRKEELYNKSYNTCDAACDPVHCETEIELRLAANEELSTDASELAAEVRSLRAVIELKQAEIASLRDARSELAIEREKRAAAEKDARAARQAAEELKERAAARQMEADRLREENRRLREFAARDREHANRVSALNEELRYKLRQKSQVVSLLRGGYMERSLRARTSSGDSARSASPPPDSPPSPAGSPAPPTPPLPAVKGVVEKHDSVSWVLEIEETPEEVATRLARKSSFRTVASPGGVKRRGGGSPGNSSPAPASPAPNASKLFRPGELDFPPPPPPLKESAGEAIYIYDDHRY